MLKQSLTVLHVQFLPFSSCVNTNKSILLLLKKQTHLHLQNTPKWPYSNQNLQSHAFLQTYNAILPTSLTSFALVTRGYSPWRPAAVISTNVLEITTLFVFYEIGTAFFHANNTWTIIRLNIVLFFNKWRCCSNWPSFTPFTPF